VAVLEGAEGLRVVLCVLLASDPVPEAVLDADVLNDPEADQVLVGMGVTLTVDD